MDGKKAEFKIQIVQTRILNLKTHNINKLLFERKTTQYLFYAFHLPSTSHSRLPDF